MIPRHKEVDPRYCWSQSGLPEFVSLLATFLSIALSLHFGHYEYYMVLFGIFVMDAGIVPHRTVVREALWRQRERLFRLGRNRLGPGAPPPPPPPLPLRHYPESKFPYVPVAIV